MLSLHHFESGNVSFDSVRLDLELPLQFLNARVLNFYNGVYYQGTLLVSQESSN